MSSADSNSDFPPTYSSVSGTTVGNENSNSTDSLPEYAFPRVIAEPTLLTFIPSTTGVMHLLSPTTEQAIMNISISLNCFNPNSAITTFRWGHSPETGDYIGEFEMGSDSKEDGTVTIGDEQKSIGKSLANWKYGIYDWQFLGSMPKRRLVWKQDGREFKCTQGTLQQPIGDTIAIFRTVPRGAPHDGRRKPPRTLQIWPSAYNNKSMLIHIVMSVFVLERRRLTN